MESQLEYIGEQAKQKGACFSQYKPFVTAIKNKDYLTAWQTVLGNKDWLIRKGIELPDNLEELACNIGKQWFANGRLMVEVVYKNGKRNGYYKEWHDNGYLFIETEYKDDQVNGIYKEWFYDGQLKIEIEYVNGKRNGYYKEWHYNGQLYVETEYKDGQVNGIYKEWFPNGQLKIEIEYNNK